MSGNLIAPVCRIRVVQVWSATP